MERLVGMAGAAAAAGRHYDTFRKSWRELVLADGFPSPVKDARPYKWLPSSITAWQQRREQATLAALRRAATEPGVPANDSRPTPAPRPHGLAARRAAVRNLMNRSA